MLIYISPVNSSQPSQPPTQANLLTRGDKPLC